MKGKGGQITLFIIIALVIVGVVVLFYFLTSGPEIRTVFDEKNPNAFMQLCIEDQLKDSLEKISIQGGSINPEHFFLYNDMEIGYLCYINENYKTCVIQIPLLKEHIESEMEKDIDQDVKTCFKSLEENYRKKGYNVNLELGNTDIKILPKKIHVNFNSVLTISKANTDRYDSFNVFLDSNLYELVGIVSSIVEWEATVGDSDPRIYMTYYPNLKVEKNLMGDGTRIYTITHRIDDDKFQFASRSVVLAPIH